MTTDARIRELELLDQLERAAKDSDPFAGDSPERRLVVHLLAEGYVNDASHVHLPSGLPVMSGDTNYYRRAVETKQWEDIANIMSGSQSVRLVLSHRGAVRRAELEQALKTGRIKDSTGIVWDGRHFRQDCRIALLDAAPERPLAVIFLDLNELKKINDEISHAKGDEAIRRYLETIADLNRDGDAYRKSGGADEVIILLPRTSLEDAVNLTRGILRNLGNHQVANMTLRACAGLIIADRPDEAPAAVEHRADLEQKRAKEASKADPARPSFLAWGGPSLERYP